MRDIDPSESALRVGLEMLGRMELSAAQLEQEAVLTQRLEESPFFSFMREHQFEAVKALAAQSGERGTLETFADYADELDEILPSGFNPELPRELQIKIAANYWMLLVTNEILGDFNTLLNYSYFRLLDRIEKAAAGNEATNAERKLGIYMRRLVESNPEGCKEIIEEMEGIKLKKPDVYNDGTSMFTKFTSEWATEGMRVMLRVPYKALHGMESKPSGGGQRSTQRRRA